MANHLNKLNFKDQETQLLQREKAVVKKIGEGRERLSEKYPFVFTLLGTFGLVATFYGFEHLIDRIEFLVNNPIILLVTGIIALAITGQLYKRIG